MRKVAVYGAGRYGQSLAEAIRRHGARVDCFIDQYTASREVLGIPVCRLWDVTDDAMEIFISIPPNPGDEAARTDIPSFLTKHGFHRGVTFLESMHRFPLFLELLRRHELLWMRKDPSEMVDRNALSELETMLCDDESVRVLERIIRFRESFTAETYVPPDGQLEYFPGDVPLFRSLESVRFVDGGAYGGETTKALLEYCGTRGIPLEYSAAFEPDPGNMVRLRKEADRLVHDENSASRFFLFPAALWSSAATLQFNGTCTSSSAVDRTPGSPDSSCSVCAVSLDCCLYSAGPNFIKLDIEGAEGEAVRGAERIIREQKPVLAVCVYHRPADLWELPLLIRRLHDGYRMYLRLHGHMGTSLVVYCCP